MNPLEDEIFTLKNPIWDCGRQTAMTTYLNNEKVQNAIHVQNVEWPGTIVYNRSIADLVSTTPQLVEKYRMLIFSGFLYFFCFFFSNCFFQVILILKFHILGQKNGQVHLIFQ